LGSPGADPQGTKFVWGGLNPGFQPLSGLASGGATLEYLPQPLVGSLLAKSGIKGHSKCKLVNPQSYKFCFAGLADGGLVSISCQGVGENEARQFFRAGFKELLQRVRPAGVLCYGEPEHQTRLLAQNAGVELITYPTRWAGIRQALKKQKVSLINQPSHETPFGGDSISNKRKG